MDHRWLLEISYDGTAYCGWQVQPNGTSIQHVLEENLSRIYADQYLRTDSSGRTDAGVHAVGQAVTFTPPQRPSVDAEKLLRALNRMLPQDIRIQSIKAVPTDFHARFSAKGKAYTYIINRSRPSPFSGRWSWHLPSFRNICEVRRATSHLLGEHDFSAFTVGRSDIPDAVRTIYDISIEEYDAYLAMTFIGNGFLYKMIRSIVGTLADVAKDKITSSDFNEILESKIRSNACDTAPPNGLFLMKVFYSEDEWKTFRLTSLPFC